MRWSGYFQCIFLIWIFVTCVFCQDTNVQLNVGNITGFRKNINVTDSASGGLQLMSVKTYLGIPYAKPPTGNLRFRKPEALESLPVNPFNATAFGHYCPQGLDIFKPTTGRGDEDCLSLNVYVPDSKPDQPSGNAVIVYIHGGSFIMGMSSMFDATYLAAFGNVIVITINYRLAMFGFLSTMDSTGPGNYGLFDQALALQWVQDNIAAFGGDPGRVTLFGQSAGAMSVILQGLYPANNQNVHRLIASSGTATTPYLKLSRDTMSSTKKIAASVDCDRADTDDLIECLRSVPWQVLHNSTSSLVYELLSMVPRVDGDFVKTDPANLWKESRKEKLDSVEFFQSLSLLTGVNYNEGGTFLPLLTGSSNLEDFFPTNEYFLSSLIPPATQFMYDKSFTSSVNRAILHEYTDWKNPFKENSTRLQYTKFLGDAIFVAPAIETARIHRSNGISDGLGKTFFYQFLPKPTNRIVYAPDWLPGSNHGDEIYFVFGAMDELTEAWEKELALTMMSYLTSYVKTGQPVTTYPRQMEWPEYQEDEAFIIFDKGTGPGVLGKYIGARETDFWQTVFPQLPGHMTTTPVTCGGHIPRGCGILMIIAACALGRSLLGVAYILY